AGNRRRAQAVRQHQGEPVPRAQLLPGDDQRDADETRRGDLRRDPLVRHPRQDRQRPLPQHPRPPRRLSRSLPGRGRCGHVESGPDVPGDRLRRHADVRPRAGRARRRRGEPRVRLRVYPRPHPGRGNLTRRVSRGSGRSTGDPFLFPYSLRLFSPSIVSPKTSRPLSALEAPRRPIRLPHEAPRGERTMNDRKPAELDATSGHVTSGAPPGATDRTAALEVTRDFLPAAGGAPAEHRLPVIPGYELDRELGRGAYGTVYAGRRADDPETPLAIKTIEGHGDLDRLMVEPALLARIKHPGVVGLEDYFVHDGKLVVALDFIPGGDLKPKLDRGEIFTPEQVLDFLVQIGSALAEAHSRQIVHRDLKPSNVLLDTSGGSTRYVLADFGIGRTAERVQVEKNIGGTYLYLAPEQLRGRAGPQWDLWAVGVVAYQMLTGKVPFPGPSVEELAKQIQYTDPPPPSVLIARPLPDRLEEAVLGLLRKSLSERTASAAELLSQLGVRTDVKSPISPTGVRTEAARKALPIAAKLERAARRAIVMLVLTVLVWLAMNAVLIGALFLVALWVFYYAQGRVQHRGRRVALTLAAFVLLSP